MANYLIWEVPMNDQCQQCGGKCCVGFIDVYSNDEIYYDNTLVWEVEGNAYDRIMQTDENSKCIALVNGKCSIYDKRPQVCRWFEVGSRCCENFRSGKINSHICLPCPISERVKFNLHLENGK